jgi:putative ABC transport system permease protein
MQLWEGVRLALGYIRSEKLKSFFSLLGVIVGIMFLIVVVSVVEGIDRYIREDFASMIFGVNTVSVERSRPNIADSDPTSLRRAARRPWIELGDAEAIRERLATPALIGVETNIGGEVEGPDGRKLENALLIAASPEMFTIRDFGVERGRPFSQEEASRGASVAVLGKGTADLLFEDEDPLGATVRIRNIPYRVVGVIEERGSMLGFSRDNMVVAPALSPLRRIVRRRDFVGSVVVQTESPEALREVQSELEGIMRARHGARASRTTSIWRRRRNR